MSKDHSETYGLVTNFLVATGARTGSGTCEKTIRTVASNVLAICWVLGTTRAVTNKLVLALASALSPGKIATNAW